MLWVICLLYFSVNGFNKTGTYIYNKKYHNKVNRVYIILKHTTAQKIFNNEIF